MKKRSMAKLVCLAMVMVLALSGCAFLQKSKDFLCNPTEAQKAEAALMLAALDAIQAAGSIFFPPLAFVKASAVLTTIINGGCFLIVDLIEIFKILDQAEAAKAKVKGLKAPTKFISYPALRATLKK